MPGIDFRGKWNYRMEIMPIYKDGVREAVMLDRMGHDGWELVSVAIPFGGNAMYYFKRPKDWTPDNAE